jgi:hypothetical protein
MTGNEDADPSRSSGPASRCAARATPARWRPSSRSSPARVDVRDGLELRGRRRADAHGRHPGRRGALGGPGLDQVAAA